MNVHRILLVSALAVPALVITACQPLPKQHGLSVQTLPVEGRLVTINPNDVVVPWLRGVMRLFPWISSMLRSLRPWPAEC